MLKSVLELLLAVGVVAVMLMAVLASLSVPAHGYGRPVTEPTNQVWPCSYPYELGLCQNKKRKDK